MDDLISRQAAIDALMKRDKKLRNLNWYDNTYAEGECKGIDDALDIINALPSAQPDTTTYDSNVVKKGGNDEDRTSGDCISRQQATCEYCHEDSDGYVLSIKKNGHAYIQNGKLALRANGWRGECAINFCPMCGRKLRGEQDG